MISTEGSSGPSGAVLGFVLYVATSVEPSSSCMSKYHHSKEWSTSSAERNPSSQTATTFGSSPRLCIASAWAASSLARTSGVSGMS